MARIVYLQVKVYITNLLNVCNLYVKNLMPYNFI